ncbi:hypothetical protein I4U23_019599 [Adineta vaga]|nr:hypothetical protein I4U23_019599 [Adineta vaga]
MYQQLDPTDVPRKIKLYTNAAFIFNYVLGLFVCLILGVIIVALIPLYLPVHNENANHFNNKSFLFFFYRIFLLFILCKRHTLDVHAYCYINNITPANSTITMMIEESDWFSIKQTIQNLVHSKVNHIEFANIADVRIVDSITETNGNLASRCNVQGCLQILGQVVFPTTCSSACQLRTMKKIESLNVIEPSIKMNLTSTLNVKYMLEFDAFNFVILKNQNYVDQAEMFLIYSLMKNQNRMSSLNSSLVDNSSLTNIRRLVSNDILQSHADICKFSVIQAEVFQILELLNVTIIVSFTSPCTNDCQQLQINKLRNITSITYQSIVFTYAGNVHNYNVSLNGVYLAIFTIIPSTTIQSTLMPNNTTFEMILNTTASIFDVSYKLDSFDLITNSDFEGGPIVSSSSLNDLSTMMQTTISNNAKINVIVYNASITSDNANTSTKTLSSLYILRLVVYYIYPITCNECIQNSDDAIKRTPVLTKIVHIRNASLVNISYPSDIVKISNVMLHSTINQHDHTQRQSTEHTSTAHHSTGHTTHHSTGHTSHHTTEHTSTVHHTTQYSTTLGTTE